MLNQKRIFRFSGYLFWVALETFVLTGLPRVVIFPLIAYLIGPEEFGFFLFAFGIVMVIGKSPSVGLNTGIIRYLTQFNEKEQKNLVFTSLRLCQIALMVIIAGGIITTGALYLFGQIDFPVFMCFLPLFLHLYHFNVIEIRTTELRVQRRFGLHALWNCSLGLALLITIPLSGLFGVLGAAWGYLFAHLLVGSILYYVQKEDFALADYNADQSHLLKSIWVNISIASVLALSSKYIYRIVLGLFYSYADVAIFFGATSLIAIFDSIIGVLGRLLLSVIAQYKTYAEIPTSSKRLVLFGGILFSILNMAGVLIFARFVLRILFPEFGEQSADLLRYMIIIIPATVAVIFSRPFVMKFGDPKVVPQLNLLNLISHIVPASILIPIYGLEGAAVSCSIGYVVTACCWIKVLLKITHNNDIEAVL